MLCHVKMVAVGALQNFIPFSKGQTSPALFVCLLHEFFSVALIVLKRPRVMELTSLQSSLNAIAELW